MRYLTAVLFSLMMAGPAVAGQCPSLVSKIDSQLASAQIDSGTRAQIEAMRDKGEMLHKQGNHGESVKVLSEALEKLKSASQ